MRKEKWMNSLNFLVGVICLMFLFSATGVASAEEKYPSKPITVVVGYAPGATDMALRVFVDKLPEYLGQPVSFLYKPGAAGSIGGAYVANSKPDGYTILGSSPSPLIISPLTKKDCGYTLDDFSPIARLLDSPLILLVKADSPIKNIHDLIEQARKAPGKLTYTSSGVFGNNHVPVEMFQKLAKIKFKHVPATGSGPSVTALLGGHVDFTSATMGAASPHIKSGALRFIASFDEKRSKEFPDVPTINDWVIRWSSRTGMPWQSPRERLHRL